MLSPSLPAEKAVRAWLVTGIVQGVGFRPWVCRQARRLELEGRVGNESGGVRIDACGKASALDELEKALSGEAPAPARVDSVFVLPTQEIAWRNTDRFSICDSQPPGVGGTPQVAPDLAMCGDCRAEIEDPSSRRFQYPFTTCARCGPRYTILEDLPFDRERTSMRGFPLCEKCAAEYADPSDRRFHAQAMACPACGPHLRWLDSRGRLLAVRQDALMAAAAALRIGQVVAVKGLGGFHLMVRADHSAAVLKLRERKCRESKPFAIMARDIVAASRLGCIGEIERRALESPAAPIVLLDKLTHCDGPPDPDFQKHALACLCAPATNRPASEGLAPEVAPGVPSIGVMLAATPLHTLLLEQTGFPLVATSGNLCEEPLCTDENEAIRRLSGIADFFLSHDRPIARRCDDSVVRILDGDVSLMRRARGYVPVSIPWNLPADCFPVLGAGGHQKNAPSLLAGKMMLQGAHVGDLDHPMARAAWHETVSGMRVLSPSTPWKVVAVDAHPDYGSTIEAARLGVPIISVQHHFAHAFAALIEAGVEQACAVVWDGTGLGTDGTIWGGEFLKVTRSGEWHRLGWLKPFWLPGGELAAREPSRSALGARREWTEDHLSADGISWARLKLTEQQASALIQILKTRTGCVLTTSAGRLFDAASAFLGLAPLHGYEGQAAMALELAASRATAHTLRARLPIIIRPGGFELDWRPAMALCAEATDIDAASAAWHATLIEGIVAGAHAAALSDVLLTGGCFQNKRLCDGAARRLREEGFRAHVQRLVPLNDGGLSAGQATAAVLRREAICTRAL